MGLVPVLPQDAMGGRCQAPVGMGKMLRNPFWGGRLASHPGMLLGTHGGRQVTKEKGHWSLPGHAQPFQSAQRRCAGTGVKLGMEPTLGPPHAWRRLS